MKGVATKNKDGVSSLDTMVDQATKGVKSFIDKNHNGYTTDRNKEAGWSYESCIRAVTYLLCFLHVIFIGVDISLPPGRFMPSPWTEIHGFVMLFMSLIHSVYSLGAVQSLAFFVSNNVIEWLFEQSNISLGGFIFGPLFYADGLLGPKVGDVPIIVPLAIYFFCWPAYCLGNLILHKKPIVFFREEVKNETYLHLAVRCLVYGMLHTAWSLSIDPACVNYGFYTYTAVEGARSPHPDAEVIPLKETYFGVPLSEFRGWTILVFTQWFVYLAVVAPFFKGNQPQTKKNRDKPGRKLELFDFLSPALLYGGFAVYLFVNPLNNALGIVACWVLGFPVIMAVYQWLSQC